MIKVFIDYSQGQGKVHAVFEDTPDATFDAGGVTYTPEMMPLDLPIVKLEPADCCVALEAINVDCTVLDEYILNSYL